MKTALVAVALTALMVDAAAAQRPSTYNMTCAQTRGLVASRGAVVMNTGQYTFERFVAAPGFCATGEFALSTTAPTVDARNCPVGYRCDSNPPPWYHGGGFGRGGRF